MASKTLYVGNLPYSTTEDDLKAAFDAWGPVTDARIVQGRGFGFVDIPAENVATAIEEMNGKDFQGRNLSVSEARPKPEARSGAGGGGGRGGGYGGGGGGGYGGGGGGGRRERW